jgi:hypothetical protein
LEKLDITNAVIRSRILKKERQYNGHKKNDKGTNNDLQSTTHIKELEPRLSPGMYLCAPERPAVPAPHVTPVVLLISDTNIILI